MKKISMLFMSLTLLAIGMMAPAAQATVSANVLYSETDLGEGLWQYGFIFENTSWVDDSHPYLWKVSLDFENYADVTLLNLIENWTVGTYTETLFLNDTVETDYLEMYSDAAGFDLLHGALLAGLSFTADYRLGEIAFEAVFSDHGAPEDWASISGTASAVPEPGAAWLVGAGLAGVAGLRRKMGR